MVTRADMYPEFARRISYRITPLLLWQVYSISVVSCSKMSFDLVSKSRVCYSASIVRCMTRGNSVMAGLQSILRLIVSVIRVS